METHTFYPRLHSYYRNLVPLFEKPKAAAYTMLILSFFTMAIFGTFAIRPTLSTIAQLKKRIADQKIVNAKMDDKIIQLRLAETAYQNVQPNLDAIFASLPNNPAASSLLGKLNRILIENNIDIFILQIASISLTAPNVNPSDASIIEFSLTGQAQYEDIVQFINLLARVDRIVTIDSITISPVEGGAAERNFETDLLTVAVQGKSYVLWELVDNK